MDAERLGDGGGDEARFTDRRQSDEAATVFEIGGQARGHLDGEPGLAGPSRPSEGEQARLSGGDVASRCLELVYATDQRRRLRGEPVSRDAGPLAHQRKGSRV